jgi:hypothetical protein
MPPEAGEGGSLVIEQVEKNEGLEAFAEVGRAHQAGDRPVSLAVRPMFNLTWALFGRRGGFGH